MVIDDISGQSH